MLTSSRPTFDRHSRLVRLKMVVQPATTEHTIVAAVSTGFEVRIFTKKCVMVLALCLGEGYAFVFENKKCNEWRKEQFNNLAVPHPGPS